jgi:hypothetical protein
MSQEEYQLWLKTKHLPEDPPEGWIEFAWEEPDLFRYKGYKYGWFPNERVAKAYFAAYGIDFYYEETV